LEFAHGGPGAQSARFADQGGGGTLIGIVPAAIVLMVTFGSFVAAGLPLISALLAVGSAIGVITFLSHVVDTPDFATLLAELIGLRRPLEAPAVENVARYGTGAMNTEACSLDPGPGESGRRWPAHVVMSHRPGCRPRRCARGCPRRHARRPARRRQPLSVLRQGVPARTRRRLRAPAGPPDGSVSQRGAQRFGAGGRQPASDRQAHCLDALAGAAGLPARRACP
jgi:hypothetical protein